jgi:flagellar hook-basal body complex protein FliE
MEAQATKENEELPSNKADFSDYETFKEKVEKHSQNVNETMERAKQGEEINLTDLMADAQKLPKEQIEKRRGDG